MEKTKKVITITTDFGDEFAAAQLKAVALSLGFGGEMIENHSITPFSILEGAFEMSTLARFFPFNTVHLGVIDPGVGSNRLAIIVQTNKSWLVGPNNGLLYPLAIQEGIKSIWKINESIFSNVSKTFHGRDIFIKVAVFLANGKLPKDFACIQITHDYLEKIVFQEGQILHIDRYGNYKVFWSKKLIPNNNLIINRRGKMHVIPIVKTFNDVLKNKPLALFGSSNTLELAVNLHSADKFFHFNLEEILEIKEGKIQ